MSNVAYTIPNLIQGVSQQPDAQRDPSQGEIQINGMSSIAEGLRKRDSSRTVARVSETLFGDAFIHTIQRDAAEKYISVIRTNAIDVFDLEGDAKTVNVDAGSFDYLNDANRDASENVTNARNQIRAVTIADFTFILNTQRTTAMQADVAPEQPRPATNECLVWVKQASYGNEYRVVCSVGNGTPIEVTVETPVAPVVSSGGTTTEFRISSEEIAEELMTGGAGDGLEDIAGLTVERSGSVLWLQSAQPINIEVFDAKSNTTITAILDEVQTFTELPTVAPEGYQVEVVGDPGNAYDNYHVEFEPRSGDFAEGAWLECVAPGAQYILDEDEMPHVLVRRPDDTFWFGPADGRTQTGGQGATAWEIQIPGWGRRTAGDDVTNPLPTFVNNKINDIFIYKNRLGFLSDEAVILSRTRDFFEFFPETVTTVLDTDPIDVIASNNKVSVLKYAVPYQDELIIFSEQYQFRFNAAETILTPATAQITILTQFDVDTGVRPLQAGGGILFAQSNDQWSQFREFSVRGAGTALTADSADITAYVSSYIPNQCYKLTINDTGNSAYVISGRNEDGETDYTQRIYVYKWFFRNSGQGAERAQSSWSYWDFNGEVLQVEAIEEQLYVLIARGSEVWLEKISIMDRMGEEVAAPYPLLLDRLVSTTTATPADVRMAAGTYDEDTDRTTWTLTYEAQATTELWSSYKMSQTGKPGPVKLDTITTGTELSTRGDWSTTEVWAGEPYEFRYRFTKFKFYSEIGGGKAAVNTYRTQIRRAKLRYHESGYFEIKVLPEHRSEGLYKYDGTTIAVRGSWVGQPTTMPNDVMRYYEGVFSFPVMGDGSRIYCEILNDTPHPCKFSTCEWIGNLTDPSRSRR